MQLILLLFLCKSIKNKSVRHTVTLKDIFYFNYDEPGDLSMLTPSQINAPNAMTTNYCT